jgi:hypothetical protein
MRVQVLEIEVESTTWQQELVKKFEARQRPKFDTLARDLLELMKSEQFQLDAQDM